MNAMFPPAVTTMRLCGAVAMRFSAASLSSIRRSNSGSPSTAP